LDTRICAGIGLAVPLPPQLLHLILPVPPHVLHPTSSSDHLVHKQGTLLDPLHVGHWLNPRGTDLSWSASIMDFIIHAPASALTPCTTWVTTPGDMSLALKSALLHLQGTDLQVERQRTARILITSSRWRFCYRSKLMQIAT
jgi:hypothetical protein